jgi:hypothetical protein
MLSSANALTTYVLLWLLAHAACYRARGWAS